MKPTKTKKIKRIITLSLLLGGIMTAHASATDFWTIYSDKIATNFSVKTGAVLEQGMSNKLTEREILALATKSFSQSFGARFSEVAHDTRGLLIVCIFSREPERCYMDNVLKTTFDEIHFVPTPGFSQKFLKKFSQKYSSTLMQPKSLYGREIRAAGVPRRKNFNPRFGFKLDGFELIASAPFYTYKNIFVEPIWGTSQGAGISFTKGRVGLELEDGGASIQYLLLKNANKSSQMTLLIRTNGSVYLENTFYTW